MGTNAAHGIRERSRRQDAEKLARVIDAHVQMALELQAVFGLRREEAIKFSPAYTDRGDRVRIKASWAKGARGRSRADTRASARYSTSPGTSRVTARCALIPGGRSYAAQRKVYETSWYRAGADVQRARFCAHS